MKKIQLTNATLKDILDYVVPMFVRERALESLKKDDKIFRSGLYLWAGDERVFKQFQDADYDKIRKAWIEKLEPSQNLIRAKQFVSSWNEEENLCTDKYDWSAARLEDLPISIAIVLFDMLSQKVIDAGTNYMHIDGSSNTFYPDGFSRAFVILAEVCNVVGDAHLRDYKPCFTHGRMTQGIVNLCKQMEKHQLDFYVARMFVRQRIQYFKNCQRSSQYMENLQRRCVALLEFLAMLERDSV